MEPRTSPADLGKGTIYNYARTKEDIIVAFLADVERRCSCGCAASSPVLRQVTMSRVDD